MTTADHPTATLLTPDWIAGLEDDLATLLAGPLSVPPQDELCSAIRDLLSSPHHRALLVRGSASAPTESALDTPRESS